MARSCGIRLGHRNFEVVVLEGGAKKAKLVAHAAGEIPPGEDPVAAAASALAEATKGMKIPTDSIALVVDTGLAAFRSVRLPFSDRDKIEEVIKFEVENQLPQWSIDSVVIDFLVLSENAVESNLIVTGVPKEAIASRIAACEKAGLEPVEVELECTAIVNAAHQAGLLDADSACVLVHFGDNSTSVVVVDGGAVKSMRGLHRSVQPGAAVASTATAGTAETEGEASATPDANLEELVVRVRRELRRTISAAATAHPIEAVYVCGHAAPGLAGEQILDTPVELLNTLPDESADGVEDPARYYAAWGAAVAQLGGGILHSKLRREELRFLGKFERLELPLAVLGLLLLTLFSVRAIISHKQILRQDRDLLSWLEWSNVYMLGQPEKDVAGTLRRPPEKLRDYAKNAEQGQVAQTARYDQIATIDGMLQDEVLALQRKMGRDVTLTQPLSALEGMTLVLGVLKEMEESLGAFTVRRIDSTFLPGREPGDDRVLVKLDLTFRGGGTLEATNRFYEFSNALKEEPWFIEDKPVKEETLDSNDGIFLDGYQVTVNPSLAEDMRS